MPEQNNPLEKGQREHMEPLACDLHHNIQRIMELIGNSSDLIVRMLREEAAGLPMAILYIEGLVDTDVINNNLLKTLLSDEKKQPIAADTAADALEMMKGRVLTVSKVKQINDFNDLMSALFTGNTIILLNGSNQGISASTAQWKERAIEEPSSQTVIRGPKEGFIENISTNITLLRRKIRNPDLRVVDRTIGKITHTRVAVIYLKGIANDKVVEEVLQRLDRIDIDSILESQYVEELIQDEAFTPFPMMINTERPDSAAGALLDGKIAILVDGTPFVLLVPVSFFNFFQSSEDYYQMFDFATFLRALRYIAFIVSMLLPSLYIAISTFHQEMLPTTLLISLAAQREGVPFPAFVEAFIMEITFEILREAGVRMPRAIGPAISIVGALVLGQAAVQAGLVSAAMVIVVSFTAISNFVAPAFNIAIAARVLRFALMLLAATLGLLGIMSGLIALLIHMSGLRSFGMPYLSPLAPLIPANLKDTVLRVPWWGMRTRPRLFSQKNTVRQGTGSKPSPPSKEKNK